MRQRRAGAQRVLNRSPDASNAELDPRRWCHIPDPGGEVRKWKRVRRTRRVPHRMWHLTRQGPPRRAWRTLPDAIASDPDHHARMHQPRQPVTRPEVGRARRADATRAGRIIRRGSGAQGTGAGRGVVGASSSGATLIWAVKLMAARLRSSTNTGWHHTHITRARWALLPLPVLQVTPSSTPHAPSTHAPSLFSSPSSRSIAL